MDFVGNRPIDDITEDMKKAQGRHKEGTRKTQGETARLRGSKIFDQPVDYVLNDVHVWSYMCDIIYNYIEQKLASLILSYPIISPSRHPWVPCIHDGVSHAPWSHINHHMRGSPGSGTIVQLYS